MESSELINLFKKESPAIYNVVSNNIQEISKEQLKDIILEFVLHVSAYINNPTIQNHFYEDLINQLEKDWKNEEEQ